MRAGPCGTCAGPSIPSDGAVSVSPACRPRRRPLRSAGRGAGARARHVALHGLGVRPGHRLALRGAGHPRRLGGALLLVGLGRAFLPWHPLLRAASWQSGERLHTCRKKIDVHSKLHTMPSTGNVIHCPAVTI